MGKNIVVYEYVVVNKEWWDNLEKGTRLYFDHDKNGYVYHYESERFNKNDKYECKSITTEDYFISLGVADKGLRTESLAAGPLYGEIELECENCANKLGK
jgi:hypothetical protein